MFNIVGLGIGITFTGIAIDAMVAADTLAAYGSLARFEGVPRMKVVGVAQDTVLAAGGDISDYQQMLKMIDAAAAEE